MRQRAVFFLALLWVSVIATVNAEPLTIAAASSYRPILEPITQAYREQHQQVVRVIYGSSGKLATQIAAGAPFDLYFSANPRFMQKLRQQLLVDRVHDDGIGQLVLWAPRSKAALQPADIMQAEIRVAIAQPRHAPYGQAALGWLKNQGLYEQIKPKLVYAENVAQAAQMVFSGAADFGLVALSVVPLDARSENQLLQLQLDDPQWLQLSYARVAGSEQVTAARAFSQFYRQSQFDALKQRFGIQVRATELSP